ncbi:MAG: hypothetical protein HY744_12015 [Deltaproteobacteria bacterium]|nr:hypothetical protein [Deltaproteobacteria bacterium]
MSVAPIPSWQERLRACFRWRHRLMHVFGGPAALGALGAIAGAAALNPDAGLALGALVAAVGSLLAGYYVTAGFDRKLVEQLQNEGLAAEQQQQATSLQQVLADADPALRQPLERILQYHASIEAEFADGIDDEVEAILQSSRPDLQALRDRAVSLVRLHGRLRQVIQQSDGRALYYELERMKGELGRTPAGQVRDALGAAVQSTERTLGQWQAAGDKQAQIRSVLTVIETNLQEFKLAMGLRKADAAMGSAGQGAEVSELQARLAAAGEACDELIGRKERAPRRVRARPG